jgi:ubiquinone/menaquinone biosynthesis C-methylase UbiE
MSPLQDGLVGTTVAEGDRHAEGAAQRQGRTVMRRSRTRTMGAGLVAGASAALLWGAVVAAQETASPREMHERHHDPQAYMAALDDPARDDYQKPAEVMRALALREGEVVADIGSGTGYFTVRFARAVGEGGRVYAVDISPDMVRHLNRRLRDADIRNVVTVLADPDDPLLFEDSVDRVVIVDTWHHIADQPAYLEKLRRILRPGGQVVHIDFQKRDTPVGPPTSEKIARKDLIAQMEAAGFHLTAEHDFLPYQYFLVFETQ